MADEYDSFLNQYMDPHSPIPVAWTRSSAASMLKDFWATVKSLMELRYGIRKCFITGILPLSLVDNTSGFNIAVSMSFEKKGSDSEAKVAEHLTQLTKYANGYHFCQNDKVEPMFNADYSLEYLQVGHRNGVFLPQVVCQLYLLPVLTVVFDCGRQSWAKNFSG